MTFLEWIEIIKNILLIILLLISIIFLGRIFWLYLKFMKNKKELDNINHEYWEDNYIQGTDNQDLAKNEKWLEREKKLILEEVGILKIFK